jgi:hypothetical protein
MITAYISFKVSWKLYELVLKHNLFTDKIAAFGILFLPSTCFWCTGITKDMLIYTSVLYLILQLFTFLNPILFKKERSWIVMILSIFIILNVRDFMLLVALGPIFLAIGARWSGSQDSAYSKWIIQLFFIGVVLVAMSSFLISSKGQEFASEAQVIQNDLNSNTTYGTNRYNLGISDFSSTGMIQAFPTAVFTAFYRPYLWEGDSLFVRISSLEAFCFFILTLRFFIINNIFQTFRFIRNNELLMTSLVFALILGFFAGYTSGLFGVLVRFKAPLLPFLFLVLMYKNKVPSNDNKNTLQASL